MAALPDRCEVVVVGGGVIGVSVAYHLAEAGIQDVVLLERKALTSGTTWHAAGLVGQLRTSINMTQLARYTSQLYRGREEETGQATGYRQCGSISIAATAERVEELKRSASMAKVFGLEVNVLSVGEIAEKYPLIRTDDLFGGIHIPSDGYANAVDITQALAKGAKRRGARREGDVVLGEREARRQALDRRDGPAALAARVHRTRSLRRLASRARPTLIAFPALAALAVSSRSAPGARRPALATCGRAWPARGAGERLRRALGSGSARARVLYGWTVSHAVLWMRVGMFGC